MDTTKEPPKVLSLCSGYGGLERGLEQVFGAIRTLAHVEVEAFAVANLVNKMETGRMVPAPIWTDLKTFRPGIFRGAVDVLTGGYPCQPFSAAGNRLGSEDPRHLWPHVLATIYTCEPRRVFLENVEGHLSKGVVQVLSDLERMAYRVECGVFSAAEVGSPHQRKRTFILAERELAYTGYVSGCSELGVKQEKCSQEFSRGHKLADPSQQGSQRGGFEKPPRRGEPASLYSDRGANPWPARPGEPQYEWEEPRVVNSESTKRGRSGGKDDAGRRPQGTGGSNGTERRKTQPELGGTPDGITDRVDRLRLLGNGVVPQTAAKAFITLHNKLTGEAL